MGFLPIKLNDFLTLKQAGLLRLPRGQKHILRICRIFHILSCDVSAEIPNQTLTKLAISKP
jgi:hypothetical protein